MHIIEAIQNVELERRVVDALHGEASVAPLMLTGGPGQRTYRVSVYPLADDASEAGRWSYFRTTKPSSCGWIARAKSFSPTSRTSCARRSRRSSSCSRRCSRLRNEEARDLFLPQALAQVDRLTALVQQLLEQARAESGELKLALRELTSRRSRSPIVASFEPQAANKGVALELERCVRCGWKRIPTASRKSS